jgi:hypothetical protein
MNERTFQSLASLDSIMGSSASEISSSSSSSVFLTFCWAWILSSSEKVRWWRFCKLVSLHDQNKIFQKRDEGAYSASMGQEVRADGLQVSLCGGRHSANGREILLGTPALRKGRESNINDLRSHCDNSKRRNVRNFEKGRRGREVRSKVVCPLTIDNNEKCKAILFFLPRLPAPAWTNGQAGVSEVINRR